MDEYSLRYLTFVPETFINHITPLRSAELGVDLLTLNIREMNDQNKADFLKDYLNESQVDICFLQEKHIDSPDYVDELGNIFSDFFCYFTVRFDKTKGVGILVRKNFCANINISIRGF